MKYSILMGSFDTSQMILIIGSIFILGYLLFVMKTKGKKTHKTYLVNNVIDKKMIEVYIKKKHKLFKELSESRYCEIVGATMNNSIDTIYEAYKQKLNKFELKTLDVSNFPNELKEEAIHNIALIEYSFLKIQELKNKELGETNGKFND